MLSQGEFVARKATESRVRSKMRDTLHDLPRTAASQSLTELLKVLISDFLWFRYLAN